MNFSLETLISQTVRIITNENREFIGSFYCTDNGGNTVLKDTVEIQRLRFGDDSKPLEKLEKQKLGVVLVPGKNIKHFQVYSDQQSLENNNKQ
mmetsp:Transcript_16967/g.25317  ORF Transcript_16967/g.25317 Transcript_16967/m.25317 type:complete len:93 (-) Transcript_16967:18-296(-)